MAARLPDWLARLPNRPLLDLHWTPQNDKTTKRQNKISPHLLVAYGTFTVMALNIEESSS